MTPKQKTLEEVPNASMPQDRPSHRMLRTWAKRIRKGEATTIPVYVGGEWSLQVLRGHKRVLQLTLEKPTVEAKLN